MPNAVVCMPTTEIKFIIVFLDTVVVKDFDLPVHLTLCSALNSDDLPNLIDTTCQTSVFLTLLASPLRTFLFTRVLQ